MLIQNSNVEEYLKDNDLLNNTQNVYSIENLSTLRNFIYIVNQKYFVKNSKFNDIENLKLFKNETAIYEIITSKESPLKKYVPKLLFKDVFFPVTVFELLQDTKQPSINDIGIVISVVKLYQDFKVQEKVIERFTPWILTLTSKFVDGIDLSDEFFINNIHQLKMMYKYEVLCHGDFKKDNVIKTNNKIYIVDWEFGGIGDKYWDICYLLASFINETIETQCSIIYDFEEAKSEVLLFIIYKDKFYFIRDAFKAYFNNVEIDKLKFISFLGLSITQRIMESSISKEKSELFHYIFSVGRNFVQNPNNFLFLVNND